MALLRIKRDVQWIDRCRKYRIIIDGREITRIKKGQTVELNVDNGRHEIFCKIDWCRSNKIGLNIVNPDDVRDFKVKSSLRGLKLLFAIVYITILWHSYLALEEI